MDDTKVPLWMLALVIAGLALAAFLHDGTVKRRPDGASGIGSAMWGPSGPKKD